MKKLRVAVSPLTNTIYAGHVLKDGQTWASNKQDVTVQALVAVAQHVIASGKAAVEIHANGEPVYRVTVEKLDGAA